MIRSGIFGAILAGLLASAAPACAGDTASLNVLGYSADGRVFVFEEYGIQDGSGFPYSVFYFIDTENDSYVPGTPIRVLKEDEGALVEARRTARGNAQALLDRYRPEENPGIVLAHNPISEADSDPHRVRYHIYPSSPPMAETSTLELKEKPFPTPKRCIEMAGAYSGFTLKLTEALGKKVELTLHDDEAVPQSRSCANGYRIGAVIRGDDEIKPFIAMIQLSRFGFEGNDLRWIAVPFRPPQVN
jgi:predicted secreted protein